MRGNLVFLSLKRVRESGSFQKGGKRNPRVFVRDSLKVKVVLAFIKIGVLFRISGHIFWGFLSRHFQIYSCPCYAILVRILLFIHL